MPEHVRLWVFQSTQRIDGDEGLEASLVGYLNTRYDVDDKAQFWMLYLDSSDHEFGSAS